MCIRDRLITLPGLPMFAHGQVEGLSEKYGMEYKRAYYTESVSYTHLRAHETVLDLVCRLLLEKKTHI